jgi:hypothetical protein
MKLIRSLIRMFFAWTLFIFLLGGLFALLGGQRSHPAIIACDIIFVVGFFFGVARWMGRRQARREAEAANVLPAVSPEPAHMAGGDSVTAITVFVRNETGQFSAVASEIPAERVPFIQTPSPVLADATSYAIEPSPTYDPAPTAEPDAFSDLDDMPGARGARMALSGYTSDATPPGAIAVSYHGETKAYVTRESWQQVGDFAAVDQDDPEYRLVAVMAVYAQNVLLGYETHYTDEDAIAFAIAHLIPHEMLERDIPNPQQTAREYGIPADVLSPEHLRSLRARLAARNDAATEAHL